MRWQFGHGTGRDAVQEGSRLASALGVPAALGRVLWARGYREQAEAERFLEPRFEHLPNPFELKGIDAAVSRLQRALLQGEPICVYGDYDVDGVTSTALLVSVLRRLGGSVDFYVPQRLVEGYGLNVQALEKLAARGTRLVVSADCGVTAVAEVDAAARLGMDVVVIDHHTASQDLPRAVAILNPHQPGCTFPGRELAAVGVAFHLLLALRKKLRESGWFNAQRPEPNPERQELQARIANDAIEKAARLGSPEQRRCLVVSSPGWHVGVVGIVASRLVEKFHRPALVIAEETSGISKGSGRSVEGFHLYDALARCSRTLTKF